MIKRVAKRVKWVGFSGALLILTACASTPDPEQDAIIEGFQLTDTFEPVSTSDVAGAALKDTFKVGDIADVSVYNVEQLTATYTVERSGNISFPLIGTVRVAGLTTQGLQEELTRKYGESYLQNPNVSVKIEPSELGKIIVDGAVETPGVFEVNDIVNLSEAIALAEGLNQDASREEVFIIRTENNERKVRSVNLNNIRKYGVAEPQIIPGDIVFVEESAGRVLFREFLRTVPLLNTATLLAIRR